jgi:hypothetical protein
MKKEKKSDLRLYELKRWTRVKIWNMIAEFLLVDWMYCRWLVEGSKDVTIMWHANQKVSEYGEIIGHKSDF